MKLLSLKFSHLNSFGANQSIDFTHPDYAQNGIFAIVGKTGSGKTTVLDAICLALYGRTPRLGKLTKGSNELMRIDAPFCESLVKILTQTGEYRFSFYQKRSKKGFDSAVREIHKMKNAQEYEVIAQGISECDEQAVQILAMSFEQFTRSVLLAQGNFSAFLTAKDNERGEILEKITGTHIYSQISAQVYETHKKLQDEYNQTKASLELLAVPDTATLEALHQECSTTQIALDNAQHALKELQKAQQAYQLYTQTQANYDSYSQKIQALTQRLAKLPLDSQSLVKAQAAQAIKQTADHLDALQDTYNQTNTAYDTAHQALTQHQQELAKINHALNHAKDALNEGLRNHQHQSKLIYALQHTQNTLQACHARQQRTKHSLTDSKQALAQTEQERQRTQSALQTLQAQKHAHEQTCADLAHTERFFDIQVLAQQFGTSLKAYQSLQQAIDEHQNRKQNTEQSIQQTKEDLVVHNTSLNLSVLEALCKQGDKLHENTRQNQATKDTLCKRLQALDDQLHSTENTLNQAALTLNQAKQSLADAQKNRELARHAQTLQELVQNLSNGTPCPVCGSTTHPSKASPTVLLIDNNDYQQREQAYFDAQKTHNTWQHKHQNQTATLADIKAQYDNAYADGQTLNQALDEWRTSLPAHTHTLAELEQLITATKASQHSHIQLTERLHQLTQSQKEQQDQEQTLTQQYKDAQKHAQHLHDTLIQALQDCQITVQGTLDMHQPPTHLQNAYKELKLKHEQWQHAKQMLAKLAQEEQTHRHAQIAQEKDSQALQDKLSALTTQEKMDTQLSAILTHKQWQLAHLLGTGFCLTTAKFVPFVAQSFDTAMLQDKLNQALNKLQSTQKTLEDHYHNTQKQISTHNSALDIHNQSLDKLKAELHLANTTLQNALSASPFDSIAQIQPYLYDPKQLNDIAQEYTDLNAQLKTANTELSRLQNTLNTLTLPADADNLGTKLDNAEKTKDLALSRHILAQERLTQAQQNQKDHKAKQDSLSNQVHTLHIWATLNNLIGSQKGDKYRNIVQSLTLDTLLLLANHHLNILNERYTLIRHTPDANKSLSIGLIDHHQGGAKRTINNLSGGESFLVSLALALALSELNSQNLHIETLFLDEGFGTLDEDTLDIALSALGELHQSGKLIGIISHIAALKERIPTHLVITKQGNQSVLSGAGTQSS